jgi:hypothetical protein
MNCWTILPVKNMQGPESLVIARMTQTRNTNVPVEGFPVRTGSASILLKTKPKALGKGEARSAEIGDDSAVGGWGTGEFVDGNVDDRVTATQWC